MNTPKTKIGVIGCGKISGIYFEAGGKFDSIDIVACADLDLARAEAQAAEYQIPRALTVDQLLADPEIQLVINLTIPAAHASVAKQALLANKSVYNEKPLTITREDAREIMQIARERNLRIGCAPDTFLGGGLQTCRKLVDDGWIGEPVGASAFMLSRGVEHWHPNPDFYYQIGGGPMFDMGPYYLTALTTILGPVKRVSGSARASFPERVISTKNRYGEKIKVEVPTHVTGVLDFESGVIGTITTSFDVVAHQLPRIEIYGTQGTLSVPDPNTFGGPVRIKRLGAAEWSEAPLTFGYTENSRGIGAADMSMALQTGRPHRANDMVAYHVLDIMHAIHEASEQSRYLQIESTMERPAPLPLGLRAGSVDL